MENNKRQCDGNTFLGFTTEKCDQPATRHAYQDKYEQYDFCDKHHFYYIHGHNPEVECKDAKFCNLIAFGRNR